MLVPTTHDEPPLRFRSTPRCSPAPRAFAFLTPPEEALVRSRFDLGGRPAAVAGMGVDLEAAAAAPTAAAAFRARHGLRAPYVLYAGRIDAGKGCAEMLAHFDTLPRANSRPAPDLVLIGSLAMELPQRSGVRYLGFVSEEEKRAALAGASVVICPSPYESLSIVLLEALRVRRARPGQRAAARCSRTTACGRAAASSTRTATSSRDALQRLLGDDGLRAAMGESGRRYVEEQYRVAGGARPLPRPHRSNLIWARSASVTEGPLRMAAARPIWCTASAIASGPGLPASMSSRAFW